MIKSLFVVGATGDILIERHWRGFTPRSICDYLCDKAKGRKQIELRPALHVSKDYLLAICRDRICLVATVARAVAPLLVLEFLHRTVDIFVDYSEASDQMKVLSRITFLWYTNYSRRCWTMEVR